ncbi:hypothetical protein HRbin37_02059 [bacterium HR37]|nr:hypothetical protein HRbin37_02059 [bacterium HR37]
MKLKETIKTQFRKFKNIVSVIPEGNVDQPIGKYFAPGVLGGYYNDLSAKCEQQFDKLQNMISSKWYSPVILSQLALGCYEKWLSDKSLKHKDGFIYIAGLLVEDQKFRRVGNTEIGVWEYNFPFSYNVKPPWISGMAQGQAISVLMRAHQITKDKRYLISSQYALRSFEHTIEEGGVKTVEKDGCVFYEEFPSVPYSHVLNGFIFALWGLYDYYIYLNDPRAKRLFEAGIFTLKRYLSKYDVGYWSKYDLYPYPYNMAHPASLFYHNLHINQLKALYLITEEPVFLAMASRWDNYIKSNICKLMAISHRISFLLLNRKCFVTRSA